MVREYENPIVGQCNVEDLQRAAVYKEKSKFILILHKKTINNLKMHSMIVKVNNCHMSRRQY